MFCVSQFHATFRPHPDAVSIVHYLYQCFGEARQQQVTAPFYESLAFCIRQYYAKIVFLDDNSIRASGCQNVSLSDLSDYPEQMKWGLNV